MKCFDESWRGFLEEEFSKAYFRKLADFLHGEYEKRTIFPEKDSVFRAFLTDLNKIKVVILGQDPYHTPGVADGLAFSVKKGGKYMAPSLLNIYKEVDADMGEHMNPDGDLSSWQEQGVLLLNNVLTVEAHKAGSHRGKGWEIFSKNCVEYLNKNRENLVFILWGRDARSKKILIDQERHLVLESAHPSPLSAHNGFFGSKPFSKTNEYLKSKGLEEIKW